MESKVSQEIVALLNVAIAATSGNDANCEATEFSTEDETVLAVLRARF